MSKKSNNISGAIEILFATLSESEQVDLMASLYYSMDDMHKDKFLEETENA